MSLSIMRNIILIIGWPVLVGGSIFLFWRGSQVYKLVKGSLVGRITMALVYTMLVEMYSLGIVCTAYMFSEPKSAYLVLPVFLVWFIVFVWSLKVLTAASQEAKKISGQ